VGPEIQEFLDQLNWVDWLLLGLVGLFAVGGIGRGFILGAVDLVTALGSLVVAVLGYRALAAWLTEQFSELPGVLAYAGAFLGLMVLVQAAVSIASEMLERSLRPLWTLLGPIKTLNRVGGMIPGATKGLLLAALLLLPFAVFPLIPSVSAAVEESRLANRVATTTTALLPQVEQLLGRELSEGLAALAPPQTGELRRVDFGPVGQIAPDPAAETALFDLLNDERQQAGLSPLQWDERLRDVGRAHSLDMFQNSFFSHTSPTTGSPFDRLRRAEITYLAAGENLAYAPNPQIAHQGLMNSPGHRDNILRREFVRVGIGAQRSTLKGVMFTQVFAN
jgi:uncharacterized protein YkwD